MLVDRKTHKVLDFKDINSLVSFGEWLKRSLSIYPDDKPIPKGHMLSHLEYIREAIYEQRVKEKRMMRKRLKILRIIKYRLILR